MVARMLAADPLAATDPPAVSSGIRAACRQNVLDRADTLLMLTNRVYRQSTGNDPGGAGGGG